MVLKKLLIISIFLIPLLFYVIFQTFFVNYSENRRKIAEIAEMIGEDPDNISIECESGHVNIIGSGKDKKINFSLGPHDKTKRCEVVVSILHAFPANYDVSFDVSQDIDNPSDIWRILFQIHEYRDLGEMWRCPPVSLEASDGKFRVFNRWDKKKITVTDKQGLVNPHY